MKKRRKTEKIQNTKKGLEGGNIIKWIPFILFVNLLPFLVKIHNTKIYPPFEEWMPLSTEYADVFGYYKMVLLYICAGLATIYLFVEYIKSGSAKASFSNNTTISNFFSSSLENRVFRIFYKKDIIIFLFLFLMILSSVFSKYKPVTYFGYKERFLGLFVWLSFFIMFFYIRQVIKNKSDLYFSLGSLIITALFLGIIGTMQSLGHDPFRMNFFKSMIATRELIQNNLLDLIDFEFSATRVYMTVYNPNNVGLVVVGLVPVGVYGLMYARGKFYKIISGISSILLIISLWRSESRAGLLAIVIIMLIMLVFKYTKVFISEKSRLRIIILFIFIFSIIAAIIIFGYNLIEKKWIHKDNDSIISYMDVHDNKCEVVCTGQKVVFEYDCNDISKLCEITDGNEKKRDFSVREPWGYMLDGIDPYYLSFQYINYNNELYLKIGLPEHTEMILKMTEKGYYFVGNEGRLIRPNKISGIGFENYQSLGSSRGYIWSRSIPILTKSIFLGKGSDTYPYVFPQEDTVGKRRFLGNPSIIVDKPHNQYIGWWIEFGLISLILILIFIFQIVVYNIRSVLVVSILGVLITFLFYDFSIYTGWLFISLVAILDTQILYPK